MAEITTEMILAVAIIVLTVLAIVVYIISGSGIIFYGIFVVALVVMFYMWYRISATPESKAQPAVAQPPAPAKVRKGAKRRRKRKSA